MYVCKLRFIVVSRSGRIKELLESLVLPERTEISVLTCSGINEDISGLDTAVIFDGLAAYNKSSHYVRGYAHSVLLTDSTELKGAQPDELWLVPYGEELISFYAKRYIDKLKCEFDLRRLDQCFNTAFDSIPDLVWFKDVKGSHLWVNDSFCGAVDKTKQQIFDRGHYYIWDIPKEEYDQGEYVCLESEDVVVKKGETCMFDEKVKTRSGMKQFVTYKSPMYDIDGTLFGTCGIANDVTSLHNINKEIEAILETMPYAILIEDEVGKVVSVSSRFYEYFPQYRERESFDNWQDEVFGDHTDITIKDENGKTVILSVYKKIIYSVFNDVIGRLVVLSDVTSERLSRQKIVSKANADFLTGLYNRRKLFEYFDTISVCPNTALLTVDLDCFKSVNDHFGHAAGDDALIITAKTLKKRFPDDFIARLGGDEFLVVSTREGSENDFLAEAEKLLDELNKVWSAKESFAALGASVGIICEKYSDAPHDFERLMSESDKALYEAKNNGKNCCVVYRQ